MTNPIENHYRLIQALQAEERFLREMEKYFRKKPGNTKPELGIRVVVQQGKPRYYIRSRHRSDTNGIYVKAENHKLVKDILQEQYDAEVGKHLSKSLGITEEALRFYEKDAIRSLYRRMHPARKCFVTPILPEDEAYADEWEKVPFSPKGFEQDDPEIITERGERVRSKSEKILADKFYSSGIPYRYECPLYLDQRLLVYPDFTLLNKRTHSEFYWEHFGMMDRPDYAASFMLKMDSYARAGIYPGEKLIMTFETALHPLSTAIMQRLIDRYLK